jgi:preprotein translocase subunit SecA
VPSADAPASNGHLSAPQTERPAIPIPTRQPSTTIDALEREFERKKKRELEHARMAGGGSEAAAPAQRRAGDKVGRNDPCPCGSGKKYKKCHGINEA